MMFLESLSFLLFYYILFVLIYYVFNIYTISHTISTTVSEIVE